MAEIEIVIKIPEETYQKIKETNMVISGRRNGKRLDYILFSAVNTGTPLPKGYGRLIDADALMEYCRNNINKTVDCNDIARFPTIIEADKAESEEEE